MWRISMILMTDRLSLSKVFPTLPQDKITCISEDKLNDLFQDKILSQS